MTKDKTVTMSRQLLPCPFCKGEAGDHDYGQEYWCECTDCGARSGYTTSRDTADTFWNLRAAPVVERQDDSALMKIAADLANRHPLRQLYLVCEHQGRINTESLHEHLDKCGDLLAGIALDIRRAITSPPAPVAAIELLREAYECGDRNVFGTDLDDRIRACLDKVNES